MKCNDLTENGAGEPPEFTWEACSWLYILDYLHLFTFTLGVSQMSEFAIIPLGP